MHLPGLLRPRPRPRLGRARGGSGGRRRGGASRARRRARRGDPDRRRARVRRRAAPPLRRHAPRAARRARRAPGAARRRRAARLPPRDARRSARASGASRPFPPTCRTAASRSPGPVDRKMVINALNSGARFFMADFEDANSPTWRNNLDGPGATCIDAVERTIELDTGEKSYRLNDDPARRCSCGRAAGTSPRSTCSSTATPVSGEPLRLRPLLLPQRAGACSTRAAGPYFYLPKLESHLEARLWNDVFVFAQEELGAARRHDQGDRADRDDPGRVRDGRDPLRAARALGRPQRGRWDYIFSIIKKFRDEPGVRAPRPRAGDDDACRSCAPTPSCSSRPATAAAPTRWAAWRRSVPSRRDPEVNEAALAKVRDDKLREAGDGYDGTWVAHPDLVPVATRGVRRSARPAAEPDRAPARGGRGRGSRPARRARPRGRDHRGGPAQQRERRPPVPRGVAPGHGRPSPSTT